MMTLEEYLELPYTIEIVRDRDDEGNVGYVAEVKELPGCITQGATLQEAAERIGHAMADHIDSALKSGLHPIPEPKVDGIQAISDVLTYYSGMQFIYRKPTAWQRRIAYFEWRRIREDFEIEDKSIPKPKRFETLLGRKGARDDSAGDG